GARTTIRLDMTSTVIDPLLVLVDEQERVVIQDDDGGTGLNAHLEVLLEPSRYTVLARGFPGEAGPYTLKVAPAVDPCAVTRTISPGQTLQGTFAPGDCAISDGGGPQRYFHRIGLV